MNDDWIRDVWQHAGEEQEMSKQEIARLLEPRVARGSRALYSWIWLGLGAQLSTLVLAGADLTGYWGNPLMFGVELAICVASLAFAAYSIRLYGELRRIDRLDESLAETVGRQLDFYRRRWTLWVWVTGLSVAMLSFALSTLVDNQSGTFPIHHPYVFVGTQVGMVLFLVVAFRVAQAPQLHELQAVLGDLEAQLLERTAAVDRGRARWRLAWLLLSLLLLAFLALGLWMAVRPGS